MFRVLFVIMLVGLLVAACGGGDDDDADPTSTGDTGESTTAMTPAADETSVTEEAGATPASTASSESTEPTTTDETNTATETTEVPSATESGQPSATEAPAATSAPDVNEATFAYGWNVALRGDSQAIEHNAMTAQKVNQSGFNWVRFQIPWDQYERQPGQWNPLPYDRMIEAMHQAGLNVLVVVAKAPEWALSDDPEQFIADASAFGTFVGHLAERYQGKVQAYEIWNEQNLAAEWGGHVNPAEYVEILKAGYQSIKAADPNAQVVFGGLTPNGINDPTIAIDDVQYLNEVYEVSGGEVSNYFDILGMHLNSTNHGPDATVENPGENEGWSDDSSFFFRRGEEQRAVLVENGDEAKSSWITEFGWTTANQAPGYEYGVDNTEQEVAQYLVRSFEIATTEWDWVSGAFVWNLNWSTLTDEADEKFAWSALNPDWSARPAYEALSQMPKN